MILIQFTTLFGISLLCLKTYVFHFHLDDIMKERRDMLFKSLFQNSCARSIIVVISGLTLFFKSVVASEHEVYEVMGSLNKQF